MTTTIHPTLTLTGRDVIAIVAANGVDVRDRDAILRWLRDNAQDCVLGSDRVRYAMISDDLIDAIDAGAL